MKNPSQETTATSDTYLTPTYGRSYFGVPNDDLTIEQAPKSPRAVQQNIYNRIDLDARNSSDLGSYICDYMDPECDELVKRAIGKVYIDHSEYPQTSVLGDSVAAMIQSWYNGTPLTPEGAAAHRIIGTVTIGSSEAIMLALMSHRQNWYDKWYEKYAPQNSSTASENWYHDAPLLMYARDVHTCWDKYSKYYNVPALVFDLEEDQYLIDPQEVKKYLNMSLYDIFSNTETDPTSKRFWDVLWPALRLTQLKPASGQITYMQNTFLRDLVCCVGGVVGTTFTGQGDPIEELNSVLTSIPDAASGYQIPLHVDAASGGFVLPFTNVNEGTFKWTFTLERVKSINVSNHKFGMVYPGCGTVVFKDENVVPESLIYKITYLGGNFTDYTVNFSRGSAMVLAAYYNLKRFGIEGFQKINSQCVQNSRYLSAKISDVTDASNNKIFKSISDTTHYPMVVWKIDSTTSPSWTLFQLSTLLERYSWKLPAYKLPFTSSETPDGTTVMRVVTRQDISVEKIDILVSNIQEAVITLEEESADLKDAGAEHLIKKASSQAEFIGSGDYR